MLLSDGTTVRKVTAVDSGAIKIALNPADKKVYLLNPDKGLFTVDLTGKSAPAKVAATTDIFQEGVPAGMTFGPDGALYMVANRKVGENQTQAIIRKGVAADGLVFRQHRSAVAEQHPVAQQDSRGRCSRGVVPRGGPGARLREHGPVALRFVEDGRRCFNWPRKLRQWIQCPARR